MLKIIMEKYFLKVTVLLTVILVGGSVCVSGSVEKQQYLGGGWFGELITVDLYIIG